MTEEIHIGLVSKAELPALIDWFASHYYESREEAESHFADHFEGQGATFLAKHNEQIAGYITVGMSWRKKIPFIANIVVFEPYRRRGLGTRLMALAEAYIAENLGDQVVLWVPILGEFGAAQRLYAQRGYIPDGCGVDRDGVPVKWGEKHTFDDHLHLCLIKDLRS
jgi:ribosomal protein S18 acetylase RimI-like enzyme